MARLSFFRRYEMLCGDYSYPITVCRSRLLSRFERARPA
jgi:hypothetical protein